MGSHSNYQKKEVRGEFGYVLQDVPHFSDYIPDLPFFTEIVEKMESAEKLKANPLKRSFESFKSAQGDKAETMEIDITLTPSDYDMKVYEVAMTRNTIAVLDSGSGKNNIAVMMINKIGKSLKNDNGATKLIVFLAPTVHLVHQQYKEIKSQTKLHVEEYYGARGVDEWNHQTWQKEINEHDVLIMTPQILLDALKKAFVSIEAICFVILDECHRATGKHPYARLMEEFYRKSTNRPKIFGMTVSSMIDKDSKEQIRELERVLDSQVYTLEDKIEHDECIPSAKPICRFYEPIQPPDLDLKVNLQYSWSKFDAILLVYKNKLLLDRLADDYTGILFCLENLGLLCAYEAVKLCLENVPKIQEEHEESVVQYSNFLHEALSIIQGSHAVNGGSDELPTDQISSKLHVLLDIFRSFGSDEKVCCIVFVERIIAAQVIERVMKRITVFSHFNISYPTGSNNYSFCNGKVNLLFSTDVIEEGTRAAKYSSLIYFDLPKTVGNYVRSMGLPRQEESHYIIMLERGNTKQIDQMSDITIKAMNKDPDDRPIKACTANEPFRYVVKSTGASFTPESSVSLIHAYCEKLPRDNNLIPKPKFEVLMDGNLYRCKLILPDNAVFETAIGPLARDFHLSRQLVCFDACKKLHMAGAFDDNVLPKNGEVFSEKDNTPNGKGLMSGAGTTKRKELHGSVSIRMLSGNWGDKLDNAEFHAYKMDFACSNVDQIYSSFLLLLENKLDDDVGNIEVDLFLVSKTVKASISSCGRIYLDAQQVAKAKCFQELIFNGLFGKLFVKSSGERKLLFQTEESLWNPSNMYLLLPLDRDRAREQQPFEIDWRGIESCVSVVEFFRKNAWLNIKQPEVNVDNSSVHVETESDCRVIHLANRSDPIERLKEMVVVAIHTGRIYSILDIFENSSSESPFEGDVDVKYSSYADYYYKKYGIVLKYPEQPLLLLKQGHNSHNLLVDFRSEDASVKNKTKSGRKVVERKPQQHAHIPPELLVGAEIRTDILKTYYLLPSLMYRMESLMLASQLREEISHHAGNFSVSSSLILEALTTQRCNESFSMERLELLGDSILKYTTSCHLYLKYAEKHEGQLTSYRTSVISNLALHKFGTKRKVQDYIRDCPFDPRRWTAPGQFSIWPSTTCKHGLDTAQVPLDVKFCSEDINLMIGKACDKGHRWMVSKTVSDCVEALIGAYYVGSGLPAAMSFMKWLGMDVEFEPSLIDDAIRVASLYSYAPKAEDIRVVESKIGYEFHTKGLLLEAMTHESERQQGVGYCYQRLEFLGDAVLDVLITCHLYENHIDVDPGMLTDLRSASVNNDSFALAAVRYNLHPHLQHSSLHVDGQILTFVKSVSGMSTVVLTPDIKSPKVLGDLIESIAGAVLIDSKLNLGQVWKVFKPLLSPIVTPDKLELPPTRELNELCDSLGYFIKQHLFTKGDVMHAVLRLHLEDALLEGQGSGSNSKAAKGMAALRLLKELELRGIKSSKCSKYDSDIVDEMSVDNNVSCEPAPKKQKQLKLQPEIEGTEIPVLPPIEMKKGGPRNALYDLCKKQHWPMPSLKTMEQKSRTPMKLGDTIGFNSFETRIILTIPETGKIELTGEARADKKNSFDSAALVMLYELERRGKIRIADWT